MARTVEDGDCWIYQGGTNSVGYGVIGRGGKEGRHVYVHRSAYLFFIGEIPEGLVLDHLCRRRNCCNPWHLEPVTHRVNLLRGVGPSAVAAKATECVNGHPFDEANTYRNPRTGHRACRACRNRVARDRRARLKGAA